MQAIAARKPVLKKQIPTLLGLAVLVVALIVGAVFLKDGPGVFAPRAAPETTPKEIRVTNVTDNSFTVSFFTDSKTVGFIKYGDSASLSSQASDDRDQLSGSVGEFNLHHITVKSLKPNTTYYFNLGTVSNATFDNNGSPFTITTAAQPGTSPPLAKTVYGSVANLDGTPAEGSVVYLSIDGVGDLSSLVKASGSWAISLANARSADGRSYPEIQDETMMEIYVQGTAASQNTSFATAVKNAQPVTNLTLGKDASEYQQEVLGESTGDKNSEIPELTLSTDAREALIQAEQDNTIDSNEKEDKKFVSTASAVLSLSGFDEATASAVTIEQPVIKGQVLPKVNVKVEVHSDTQFEDTVTADENGEFSLDFSQYGVELEPGLHTVTYTWIDPETGIEHTRSQTFIVEDTSSLVAQAASYTDETTYSSGDPYSPYTATATPTPTTATTSATVSAETKGGTRSAVVSTSSGTYQAGSVTGTMILVLAGLFFVGTGVWSWWLATQMEKVE
ncbi:MAG: fibronectin type III domain-containing protein [Candidatus Woesebacteria bacterium]|jgi:hypothetical protein